jgi:uncharacterized protein (DUF362 family)
MKETSAHENSNSDCGRKHCVSRRDFIRTTAAGAAGAALLGSQFACSAASGSPRMGAGNLFMEGDKPLLVVVEGTDLDAMLDAGLDAMGGLKKLVAGKTVVMKPNIVSADPPPVTTSVDMVIGAGKRALDAGARSVTACDACGSGVTTASKFDTLNYTGPLKEAGIGLDAVDFGDRMAHTFVTRDKWRSNSSIGVVKTLYEAEVIINLPMVKRHDGAHFTCALKNHFGSVYFPLRQVAHRQRTAGGEGQKFFDVALAEFADSVKTELNIVDARSLLTRNGPTLKGRSEIKSGVNRIILCGDMLATDVYCSHLKREHDDTYSHDMISTQLETAGMLGIGIGDLNNVAIKEIIV